MTAAARRAVELGHPQLPIVGGGLAPPAAAMGRDLVHDMVINLDVPGLDDAVRFYEQGLGLSLRRRLFENTVAEMSGAPCLLYLLEKATGSEALPKEMETQAGRDYARHWTPVHLDFIVEALEPAVERLIAAGATLETGPTDFVWGRQATFSDPFGHGICLVQWLGRGYGEVEG